MWDFDRDLNLLPLAHRNLHLSFLFRSSAIFRFSSFFLNYHNNMLMTNLNNFDLELNILPKDISKCLGLSQSLYLNTARIAGGE